MESLPSIRNNSPNDKQKDALFQQIFLASSEPILVTSNDLQIQYVNKAWEKLTGYTLDEIRGKTPEFLRSDKTPKKVHNHLSQSLKKGIPFTTREIINIKKNGTEFQAHSSFFPVNITGDGIMYVQFMHDITKHSTQDKEKEEFINTIAHELRTPITVLKLASRHHLQKALHTGHTQIKLEELTLIANEVDRMARLISDMVDNARIETGKFSLSMEFVDLGEIVKTITKESRKNAKRHKILMHRLPKITIVGDKQRLEQVFVNLLTNAIKYSPENTTITVKIEKTSNDVIISVKDQGIGISKEKLHTIFKKYFQIKDRSATGIGLGLFITKQIVKLHKGKLWVKSKVKKGSTFYVSLPLPKLM